MSRSCEQNRLVDPDFAGEGRRFGSTSYEALRVTLVSNIEYVLALPQDVFSLAIVNHRWRQQAYAGMTVLFVVPAEKTLTKRTTVLDAPKAVRELRPIFQGSELAFGKGIVVRDVRPTMRFLFDGSPRVLQIDDIPLEAELAGTMLYLRNRDEPGVIRQVGSTLGNLGVNIATFALGRREAHKGAEAVSLVRLDGAVSDSSWERSAGSPPQL